MDVDYHQATIKKVYQWHRADFDDIRSMTNNLSGEFLNIYDTDIPIKELWSEFKDICKKCLNQVPIKLSNKRPWQPWITARIRQLSYKKQRLYNKARLSGNSDDFHIYKDFKKTVQKECRNAHTNYLANSLNNSSGSKRLWSYIKGKKKDQTGVASMCYNDQVYIDDQDKANILNQYFSSVFIVEDTLQAPVDTVDKAPEMQPISINPAGIASLLSGLKPFKATGPDEIPVYLLKEIANQLAPSLTLVFKASLNQSKLPSDWKTAHIVPAHKKGDRSLPNNYRPISLTSLCCKASNILSQQVFIPTCLKLMFFVMHNMVSEREEVVKAN